jgi:ribosomal subunit interface protein
MDTPLEIAFVNMESSEALKTLVQERADKLHRYFDRINSVRVAVEVDHKSAGGTKAYRARIETRVPGQELVVSQDPGDKGDHFDAYRTVRVAFDAMERQLEAHSKKLRGRDKAAMAAGEGPPQGRVLRVFPEYGFVEATDGREIYFHANALVGCAIEDLQKGQPVEMALIEEPDNAMGPQASTVKLIGAFAMRDEPPSNG